MSWYMTFHSVLVFIVRNKSIFYLSSVVKLLVCFLLSILHSERSQDMVRPPWTPEKYTMGQMTKRIISRSPLRVYYSNENVKTMFKTNDSTNKWLWMCFTRAMKFCLTQQVLVGFATGQLFQVISETYATTTMIFADPQNNWWRIFKKCTKSLPLATVQLSSKQQTATV